MAHKKSGGSSNNGRDSKPSYLGLKRADGEMTKSGGIIVRQRGTKIRAGINVATGRDHTLFAKIAGIVKFINKDNKKFAIVIPSE